MHCNLRPPKPCQSYPTLITTPCQFWSCWTYPLPYYSVFCCYYIALRCDLDLWPWKFMVYRLWCDETMCQIWRQSSNPQQSYCDFSIWPNDLEDVCKIRDALGSGILFTKFDLRQLIDAWSSVFWRAYVMSCCNLDLRESSWYIKCQVMQSLYNIGAKSSNPRLNYW